MDLAPRTFTSTFACARVNISLCAYDRVREPRRHHRTAPDRCRRVRHSATRRLVEAVSETPGLRCRKPGSYRARLQRSTVRADSPAGVRCRRSVPRLGGRLECTPSNHERFVVEGSCLQTHALPEAPSIFHNMCLSTMARKKVLLRCVCRAMCGVMNGLYKYKTTYTVVYAPHVTRHLFEYSAKVLFYRMQGGSCHEEDVP